MIDSAPAKIVDRDGKGNVVTTPVMLEQAKTFPVIFVQPPQARHSIKNDDPTASVHLIRIEGKKGIPHLVSFPKWDRSPRKVRCRSAPMAVIPRNGIPRKASAIAAPGNHKIVFENENLRVICVTIPAGAPAPTTTILITHSW